jgi:hypothetical protein
MKARLRAAGVWFSACFLPTRCRNLLDYGLPDRVPSRPHAPLLRDWLQTARDCRMDRMRTVRLPVAMLHLPASGYVDFKE